MLSWRFFVVFVGFASSISWRMSFSPISMRSSGWEIKVISWLREMQSWAVRSWERSSFFKPAGRTPRNSSLKGMRPLPCSLLTHWYGYFCKNICFCIDWLKRYCLHSIQTRFTVIQTFRSTQNVSELDDLDWIMKKNECRKELLIMFKYFLWVRPQDAGFDEMTRLWAKFETLKRIFLIIFF